MKKRTYIYIKTMPDSDKQFISIGTNSNDALKIEKLLQEDRRIVIGSRHQLPPGNTRWIGDSSGTSEWPTDSVRISVSMREGNNIDQFVEELANKLEQELSTTIVVTDQRAN